MKLICIKDYCGYKNIIDLESIMYISPIDAGQGYLVNFKNDTQVRISDEQFEAIVDIVDKM